MAFVTLRDRASLPLVALALSAVAAVAACGQSPEGESGSSSSVSSSASAPASSTPTASTPSASLSGAALSAISRPPSGGGIGLLRAARLASQSGYDRFVLEFSGALPGYDVRYVDGPIRADPSDQVLAVDGSAYLLIRLEPASGVDLMADGAPTTYTGPGVIRGDTVVVREAVAAGDFEAVMSWVLGVDGRQAFRVTELTGPPRLVIDVSTNASF
ncbi:unannotated protein [freshwater metagenome]|uniref:Unannotated protein n=1 Tax=freshwater metagenome TaxID=449393 RepID=A0A6J7KX89_9ZZZZ